MPLTINQQHRLLSNCRQLYRLASRHYHELQVYRLTLKDLEEFDDLEPSINTMFRDLDYHMGHVTTVENALAKRIDTIKEIIRASIHTPSSRDPENS